MSTCIHWYAGAKVNNILAHHASPNPQPPRSLPGLLVKFNAPPSSLTHHPREPINRPATKRWCTQPNLSPNFNSTARFTGPQHGRLWRTWARHALVHKDNPSHHTPSHCVTQCSTRTLYRKTQDTLISTLDRHR